MEIALREFLEREFPELKDRIFPTNAPQNIEGVVLIYARLGTEHIKTFEGLSDYGVLSFMFSVLSESYADMKGATDKIVSLLKGLPSEVLNNFRIEDLDINNVSEVYEHELGVNRGIIDFTVYFKEVNYE